MFPKHLHRLLVVIILQFFVPAKLYAQAPNIEWINLYGGSQYETLYFMDTTIDGGCILAGSTISNDGDIYGYHGFGDAWVVKLSSEGFIMWQKCYGGSSGDAAYSIKQTSDGGYILAGYTMSSDGDVSFNHGSSDFWVVKINAEGDIIWERSFGGTSSDRATHILETHTGDYLITGYSSSNDGDVYFNQGGLDYCIIKVDNVGNFIWSQTFGGSEYDIATCAIEANNGYIIAGRTESNSGDVTGFQGQSDYWIIKTSEDGDLLWERTYGGSDLDGANSVVENFRGQYVISGYSYSADGDVSVFHGGEFGDCWVIIVDTVGSLIDEKCFGGLSDDAGYQINNTIDSCYIITCSTMSDNGDVAGFHGTRDMWLIKSDSLLNIQWQKCMGGLDSDFGLSTYEKPDGSYFCAGYSNSNDGEVIDNNGYYDFLAIKLSTPCIPITYFVDLDSDNYGDSLSDSSSCVMPLGYVTDSTDCNDTNPDIHPSLTDICNSVDENCNGLTDEDATFITYYVDADSDTYGDPLIDSISCSIMIGFVENDWDCNDVDSAINPDAIELCNGIDDNCNTIIDEGLTIYIFYLDADSDTYGDPTTLIDTCAETVTGYVSNNFDCNDADPTIYPGAEEICNYLDDDCDGVADDNLAYTWQYQDADGDNYGNVAIDTLACLEIPGYITDSTDCNDLNPNTYPGAPEILNGLDDDCDGQSDEGLGIINDQVIQLSIHPIPATDHIIIDFLASTPTALNIFTSSGAIIYQNPHWSGEAIDINNLPPAMYYLQLLQLEQVGYGCFVKE